jgi:hypothetical protein
MQLWGWMWILATKIQYLYESCSVRLLLFYFLIPLPFYTYLIMAERNTNF